VVRLVVRVPTLRKLRPLRLSGDQTLEGRLVGVGRGFFFVLLFLLRTQQSIATTVASPTHPRTVPNMIGNLLFGVVGFTTSTVPVLMFIFMISSPFKMASSVTLGKLEGPTLTLSLPEGSLDFKTKSV
jgi:hypothetical protein